MYKRIIIFILILIGALLLNYLVNYEIKDTVEIRTIKYNHIGLEDCRDNGGIMISDINNKYHCMHVEKTLKRLAE